MSNRVVYTKRPFFPSSQIWSNFGSFLKDVKGLGEIADNPSSLKKLLINEKIETSLQREVYFSSDMSILKIKKKAEMSGMVVYGIMAISMVNE